MFTLCSVLSFSGQLVCGRLPSLKQMDLALDLMAEFVFCEVDRRGNKRHGGLSDLHELELLEVLHDYLINTANETARNSLFLSLFSGTAATVRSAVLSKLVSIAVGIPSPLLLISASSWMQQLGNTSLNSYKLANIVVEDYFVLTTNVSQRLNVLPHLAPQFTANFLTAVSSTYYTDGIMMPFAFPPELLLKTVTCWIKENSRLCVAGQQIQSALPPGAIAMEATTPITGLLKWSILAPIYNQNSDLYGQLHLGLLNSMLDIAPTNPPRAICAQHLAFPVSMICRYVVDVQTRRKKSEIVFDKQKTLDDDANLQITLDRFAQAVQVALSANCVYGNIGELINQLEQLPSNRLIQIVVRTYRVNK